MSYLEAESLSPTEFYARRSVELRVAADESAVRYSRHTLILAILGLLGCLALFQSVFAKRWPLWTAIPVVAAVAWVVEQRHRCHLRSVQLGNLIEYYEKGAARLIHKLGSLDGGDSFLEEEHLYSKDLDLFGHGSLYQLLCSARTHVARETLARWMKAPAELKEIQARQQAISELRPRRDLPESVAAAGALQVSDFRPEFFNAWIAYSSSSFPTWARVLAFLLGVGVIVPPVLYWSGFLSSQTFWVALSALLFTEAIFACIFRGRVKSILESLGTLSIELPTMRERTGAVFFGKTQNAFCPPRRRRAHSFRQNRSFGKPVPSSRATREGMVRVPIVFPVVGHAVCDGHRQVAPPSWRPNARMDGNPRGARSIDLDFHLLL